VFEKILETLPGYSEKYALVPGYDQHLVAEVQERLKQLDSILIRIRELERSDEDAQRRVQTAGTKVSAAMIAGGIRSQATPDSLLDDINNMWRHSEKVYTELKTQTESFYYNAWRIYSITRGQRHKLKPLPEVSFTCKGVREVRNHLIEHSDRDDSGIVAQSFASGGATGPVIKPGRPAGQPTKFQDRGLLLNAREFAANLLFGLETAISKKP
jgi:hypothetical protein